ncbi:MAG: helix-turn-helix domain-containing protein [Candidatus Bathyarchaeota archaeon]
MNLQRSQGKLYFTLNHPLRSSIVEILMANGALRSTEISDVLNISLSRCVYHLDNLRDLIKKDENQCYQLNEKGIAAHKLFVGQRKK